MDVLQSKKALLRERLREKFSVEGKRALVFGLGVNGGGVGVARFLARIGFDVTVTDMKQKDLLSQSVHELRGLPITFVLGRHRMSDVRRANLIIKNPAVPDTNPFMVKALKWRIPITNDGEIFLTSVPRERLIGITGTKGKTTTTYLIKHLLGSDAMLVGTPRTSFFECFSRSRFPKWIVAEFSSFDLEHVSSSPHIAICTNLFSDHLDRYGSFREYARTKMNILKYQQKGDMAFLGSSSRIEEFLPKKVASKIIWIKKSRLPSYRASSWRVPDESVAIATRLAETLCVSKQHIRKRLATFDAPPGRLEVIAKKKGRIFINDTTATNPGAAIHSLTVLRTKAYPKKPITIITGGVNKNFPKKEIEEYAHAIKKLRVRPVFLAGSFSDKLARILKNRTPKATNMQEAVATATESTGIIALIPSAASFNLFRNEFDRASKFIEAVKHIRL